MSDDANRVPERGLFVYPWDLMDEGVEPTLEAIKTDYLCSMIGLNCSYHSGRFLHPRYSRTFSQTNSRPRRDEQTYGRLLATPAPGTPRSARGVFAGSMGPRGAGLGAVADAGGDHRPGDHAFHVLRWGRGADIRDGGGADGLDADQRRVRYAPMALVAGFGVCPASIRRTRCRRPSGVSRAVL